MMAKQRTNFVCTNCGANFPSWAGKCSNCGQWNTLVDEEVEQMTLGRGNSSANSDPVEVLPVSKLPQTHKQRIITGVKEFDRVLGSDEPGVVAGSIILLAGSPGVGKSTLLLQIAASLKNALYFSAEESLEQIRSRSYRLGIEKSSLLLASERNLNKIIATIKKEKPDFVVIDSIQTVYDDSIPGTPGAVMQVRDNCWRLQQLSKISGTAILLVGHITKEGAIAGPKVLEHLVDVVLYLEGEKRTGLRILRAEKNRFGSTEEIGIWQLTSAGYKSVEDPGKLFASLVTEDAPGRSLSITIEGTRPFLLEIQALVAKSSFGNPKRTAQGFDANRLSILLAVIENQLGLPLSGYDVFVNIVGGFTVRDPGVDLAVAGAIISSYKKKPLQSKMALVGEIGLLGEIRPAFDHAKRVKEAKRLGYETNRGLRSVKDIGGLVE